MDSDLIIRQFEQMEQRVEELIGACREFENRNIELENQVAKLRAELQQKQETENRYQEEKRLVRTKIDGLLSKLDTIAKD